MSIAESVLYTSPLQKAGVQTWQASWLQGKDPGYPQELLVMWQTARAACKRICDLVVDGSPNSLRVVAVKFLEQAIVLCTKELPPKHALLKPAEVCHRSPPDRLR